MEPRLRVPSEDALAVEGRLGRAFEALERLRRGSRSLVGEVERPALAGRKGRVQQLTDGE